MAWNSYVDNIMDQCQGMADKAAIIGLNDGASWTSPDHCKGGQPAGLSISAEEGKAIAAAFSKKDFSPFQSGGVIVEGKKYRFLRELDGCVNAKLKDHGGLTMQASKTAVIIAHTKEGCQQGTTATGVNRVVEYLQGSNY